MFQNHTPAQRRTTRFALIGATALGIGFGLLSQPVDAIAKTPKKTLAIIVPTLSISVLQIEEKAAVDEAHKLGYKTIVLTHNFDTTKEFKDAQEIITDQVAGAVWNVANLNASSVAVKKVRNAGIPVVNMDRVLQKHEIANVSFESNNFQCGALAAKAFIKFAGDKGAYAEIAGPASDPMGRTRSAGYHSVLNKTSLKMVAHQNANYSQTAGFKIAGSILQAHPHILGFVTGNDSIGLGAAAAIKQQHKHNMVVVGIDGGHAGVAAAKSGTSAFKATAAQPVVTEAKDAVDAINKIIKGDKAVSTGKVTQVDCKLVTKSG